MSWQMSRWGFILALAGLIASPDQTVNSQQSVLGFFIARDRLVEVARAVIRFIFRGLASRSQPSSPYRFPHRPTRG